MYMLYYSVTQSTPSLLNSTLTFFEAKSFVGASEKVSPVSHARKKSTPVWEFSLSLIGKGYCVLKSKLIVSVMMQFGT